MFTEEPLISKTSPHWLRQLDLQGDEESRVRAPAGKLPILPPIYEIGQVTALDQATTLDLIQEMLNEACRSSSNAKNWMPEKCMVFWLILLDKILVDAPCSGIGLASQTRYQIQQRNIRFRTILAKFS